MPGPVTNSSDAYDGTDALTDSERVAVRRYCYYPAFGPGNASFQSWRFFEAYGLLEYRLTNMAPDELATVRMYLTQLPLLENAIQAASAGLNVETAAVFTRNPRELLERKRLYDYTRKQLCDFMGVPPGPQARAGGSVVI